jgi:hypothetical protein
MTTKLENITSVNQLVELTMQQDGIIGLCMHVRKHINKDKANQALCNWCYQVAFGRLKMLIRTQADKNTFALYDALCSDLRTNNKQYLTDASLDDIINQIVSKLTKHYNEKLIVNKSHRVKKLVSVKAIEKMINNYLSEFASNSVHNSTYTFVNDIAQEVVTKALEYNLNIVELLKQCNYDTTNLRNILMTVKTDFSCRKKYKKSKHYLHYDSDNSIDYIYSIKADGSQRKALNLRSTDVVAETDVYYYPYVQHYLYTDLLDYVSNCIASNSHSKNAKSVSGDEKNSDTDKTIFDVIIDDVDASGKIAMGYITAEMQDMLDALYEYLINVALLRPSNAQYVAAIATLKAQGYNQKEIAKILDVDPATVSRHWKKQKELVHNYLLAI